jgi:hypothetical protein
VGVDTPAQGRSRPMVVLVVGGGRRAEAWQADCGRIQLKELDPDFLRAST